MSAPEQYGARRIGGWGFAGESLTPPAAMVSWLDEHLGRGTPQPAFDPASAAALPEPRPPAALPGFSGDRLDRLGHARGQGLPDLVRLRTDLAARLVARGVDPAPAAGLARRLRAGAWLACDLARGPEELAPLAPGLDLCLAEVRAHLRHGAVLHLEDLMLRRTRLGMWSPAVAAEVAPRLERVAAEEAGWTGRRWQQELERLDMALAGWRPEGIR